MIRMVRNYLTTPIKDRGGAEHTCYEKRIPQRGVIPPILVCELTSCPLTWIAFYVSQYAVSICPLGTNVLVGGLTFERNRRY